MILYSEPKSASNLPVIDLGPSLEGDDAAMRQAASEIGRACRDTGFFYVANHGVAPDVVARGFAEANRFFDQPAAKKLALQKRNGSNGYEPPEAQKLDKDSPGDLKESFNFTSEDGAGTDGFKPSLWPDDLPGFRDGLEALNRDMRAVGLHLSRLIALSLDLPVSHFDAMVDPRPSPLRILRYPPQPDDAAFNQLGAGAHTDWGWITLLAQDDLGGLEIETAAGDWVRVEPIEGTFVVNLADLVARWTNGTYHSSLHRVMNNRSGRNRHSIVLFYNLDPATPVECLPQCLAPGEKPRFPPCTAGEHQRQRYIESREGV